jgi:FMNH2-dependent dimethyl sulfone monooxygenase
VPASIQSVNPVFNTNKLKLGTFATNTIGSVKSVAPEAYKVTWENSLRAARAADAAGLEAILGLARWKNAGTGHIHNDRGNIVFDSFTWTAGLAMATKYSAIFATSHAPTVHPLVLAKMAATIDHISGGRFGLNVVGGWNRVEFEMFNIELLEHDLRYDYLTEWLTVIEKLWRTREVFDHEGRFFKLAGALSMPQPLQQPRPPIMNAAVSGRGQKFACEFADCCFVASHVDKAAIQSYKTLAREEFGREVAVWTQIPVVQRATHAEAKEFINYILQHEDTLSVDGWRAGIAVETKSLKGGEVVVPRILSTMGGTPIIGDAAEVADELEAWQEKGIDGVLLSWFDFDDGIKRLNEEVLPLLEKRGLREPFAGV